MGEDGMVIRCWSGWLYGLQQVTRIENGKAMVPSECRSGTRTCLLSDAHWDLLSSLIMSIKCFPYIYIYIYIGNGRPNKHCDWVETGIKQVFRMLDYDDTSQSTPRTRADGSHNAITCLTPEISTIQTNATPSLSHSGESQKMPNRRLSGVERRKKCLSCQIILINHWIQLKSQIQSIITSCTQQ